MTLHQELIEKSSMKLGFTMESNSLDLYPVGADMLFGKRVDSSVDISLNVPSMVSSF